MQGIKPNNISNNNIDSIRTDFLFFNQMTKPSHISSIQVPTNLNELHNILKKKNSKIPFTELQRQKCTNQMTKRYGVDIGRIKFQLKKAKQIVYKKQQIKKIQQDCHFYIPDMSYKNINQYLQRSCEYSILSTVCTVMKKSDHLKSILKRSQLKFSGIKSFGKTIPKQQMGIIKSIKTQVRDNQKRQLYIKATSLLVTEQIQRDQFVSYLNNTVKKGFWKIFSRHLKCLQQHRPNSSEKIIYLYHESLKLVQQEYQQIISKSSNSLRDCLDDHLRKATSLGNSYIRDSQHKSFWGKVFILYRAGRFRDLYNLLGSRNENLMITSVRRAEQSITKKQPICIQNFKDHSITADIFRDQLIHILKGQLKYSSDIFVTCDSLDIIWIYLRSLAIYPQKISTFEKMKAQLLDRYKKQYFQSKTVLNNYLYLLCYDRIAEIGSSEIMDQDDYLHFLIALYQNPGFVDKFTYQKLQQILTRQLVFSIKELINMGRKQFIYYMTLIPLKSRNTQISTIIANSNLISNIDWSFFMKNFNREEYNKLVRISLQKYLLTTSDYLGVASLCIQLQSDYEQAIKCLLKLLMKNLLSNHLNSEQVRQAQKLCEYNISQSSQFTQKYIFTLGFVKDSYKLYLLLQQRNIQPIISFICNSSFIISSENYDMRHVYLLSNTCEISGVGLDIYCKFIKNVVKGIQYFYARQSQDDRYLMLVQRIREGLQIIFNQKKYYSYKNKQESRSLIEMTNNLAVKFVSR